MLNAHILREPTEHELNAALEFLKDETDRPATLTEPALWQYGFGTIDPEQVRVTSFTPFGTFKNSQWQVSGNVPDPEHGWALLTKTGGHPGNDLNHAVIRRWTAPRDGVVSINGEARHPSDQGDGIRAWALNGRTGQGEQWIVQNQSLNTSATGIEVNEGDELNLVVDCRTSPNHDSFTWLVTIHYEGGGKSTRWNSSREFSGPQESIPPLKPLEKLAQVLLVSNEFFFID